MTANITELGDVAQLRISMNCPRKDIDGLPVSYQPSFSLEVRHFGQAELRKALADSKMITSLLQEHPDEMGKIVNHALVGEMQVAKELALRIGMTEETFQQHGGGLLWWILIAVVGGAIYGCAAFGC